MPIFEDAAVLPASTAPTGAFRRAEPAGRPYARLADQIRRAGLMERRRACYLRTGGATVAVLAAGWSAFALIGDSWWQLVAAVVLAVAYGQVGFLVHDAGHRQILVSRRANDRLGLPLATLGIGLSYRWWVHDHNRHHAHPNEAGRDPGIDVGTVAFTPGQAAARGRVARFAGRYQAYYFLPLLPFTALLLRWYSVRDLARPPSAGRGRERVLLVLHLVAYVGALLWVLSPERAIVFAAVHQGLFGLYVGGTIAPNHKGMVMPGPGDRTDFLWRQVATSRNLRSGRLVTTAFGGLNYQIEHHLFPALPRANLRAAQPIVRRFLADEGLPYTETGVLASYAQALRHLHTVARPHPPGPPGGAAHGG